MLLFYAFKIKIINNRKMSTINIMNTISQLFVSIIVDSNNVALVSTIDFIID